jgi:hypothetical protein
VAVTLAVYCAAGSARAQVPAPSAPGPARAPQVRADSSSSFRLTVSADTILVPSEERLPIVVRPGRPMAVVATVALESQPAVVLWRSDTLPPGEAGALGWDLLTSSGEGLPSGRYALEVTARDSAGAAARARRTLVLTRLAADTQPLPRPLAPRDLEPETVQVRQTAPWAILIGAGAGLLPSQLGRRELNTGRRGDPKRWIVVSTVTVAGFVAFFAGHRPEFSPENAAHNGQVRRERDERLAAVLEANARAWAVAPYRIQVEGNDP